MTSSASPHSVSAMSSWPQRQQGRPPNCIRNHGGGNQRLSHVVILLHLPQSSGTRVTQRHCAARVPNLTESLSHSGKQDTCQVAVCRCRWPMLGQAGRQSLYLPEAWASDMALRKKAGVPEEIGFQTKIAITRDQIRAAHAAGLPGDLCRWMRVTVLIAICARRSRRLAWPMLVEHHGVGARQRAVAAQALDAGPGPTNQAAAPRRGASAGPHQGPCLFSLPSMANDHLARGNEGSAQIALCAPAGSYRQARLRAQLALAGGMVVDRMAKGEKQPTKYWLSTLPKKNRLCPPGRSRRIALTHRTRYSGTQAGDRARPL